MSEVDPLIESLYRWSDVSGVLLMGIIGGTIARKSGYDIIGFFFIAMFSSLGGGMVRDVLINQGTVAAMSEPEYLYLAFTGALIARFVYFKGKTWDYIQAHVDAVVSGLWAGTGAVKAITYGLPLIPCIMMGVFTATGGSMIRDISMGREPAVFGNNQPTVIPAIACASIVLIGNHFGMLAVGMVVGPLVSIFLALLGIWAGWRVPAHQDWAPINDTAAQVKVLAKKAEHKSRAVGRKLEPHRVRSWRHRQMEAALQRRMEKEARSGKRRKMTEEEVSDFMDSFDSDVDQLSASTDSGAADETDFGMDLSGDSYDTEEPVSTEESQRLLDAILADDKLTDELIERLMSRYNSRD